MDRTNDGVIALIDEMDEVINSGDMSEMLEAILTYIDIDEFKRIKEEIRLNWEQAVEDDPDEG